MKTIKKVASVILATMILVSQLVESVEIQRVRSLEANAEEVVERRLIGAKIYDSFERLD